MLFPIPKDVSPKIIMESLRKAKIEERFGQVEILKNNIAIIPLPNEKSYNQLLSTKVHINDQKVIKNFKLKYLNSFRYLREFYQLTFN